MLSRIPSDLGRQVFRFVQIFQERGCQCFRRISITPRFA